MKVFPKAMQSSSNSTDFGKTNPNIFLWVTDLGFSCHAIVQTTAIDASTATVNLTAILPSLRQMDCPRLAGVSARRSQGSENRVQKPSRERDTRLTIVIPKFCEPFHTLVGCKMSWSHTLGEEYAS
jgi:hypothetical protein